MTTLDALAERVARGEPLQLADAGALLDSYDLIAIGMLGDEVRRHMHGTRATFVRVFEIHSDTVPSSLPSRITAGEFRIIGRPTTSDAAVTAVRAVRALAGAVPVTGFSMDVLLPLVATPSARQNLFSELKGAGLDAIAEVAVDEAEEVGDAIAQAREAGLVVTRLTVRSLGVQDDLNGADATADSRVRFIARARELQRTIGGFRSFAPLPRTMPVTSPTTGYDDVKQLALARLLVPEIASIQVDWALYGPKLAQVGLTVGADDVDSVAAVDAGMLGPRRTALEEIRRNIHAAALEAVERDGLFRPMD